MYIAPIFNGHEQKVPALALIKDIDVIKREIHNLDSRIFALQRLAQFVYAYKAEAFKQQEFLSEQILRLQNVFGGQRMMA